VSDQYAIDSTKIHHHLDKLAYWKYSPDKTLLTPIYVEVSPVGYCNHRCTFCALDFMGYKQVSMPKDRLLGLMGELSQIDVRSVMFGGEGEPLLHPNLEEVITLGGKYGLSLAVTTNGVALTDRYLPSLQYVDWIKLSVNAGNRDTYQKVHQPKTGHDWDKVWANLQKASEYVRRMEYKTVLGVQAVVLPENLHSLYDLARLAKCHGAKYLVLKPYSQHGYSRVKRELSYYREEYETIRELLNKYGEDKSFNLICRYNAMQAVSLSKLPYPTCLATPYFWGYITASGDVYGCSAHLTDDRFNYGNINTSTFPDIWLGDKRVEGMKIMEKFPTSQCRKGCRMNEVNKYLWMLKRGCAHEKFI
jgi:cyclic pyranopterin phosphate synthase